MRSPSPVGFTDYPSHEEGIGSICAIPPAHFSALPMGRAEAATEAVPQASRFPLGIARGQVANTYIVAEAEDGLVIVDQHAAHERLVLERMRAATAQGQGGNARPAGARSGRTGRTRLRPAGGADRRIRRIRPRNRTLRPRRDAGARVPALLGTKDVAGLVRDLADDLAAYDEAHLP